MKVLFVNSCVRENSRTLALSKAYLNKYCVGDIINEVNVSGENLSPLNAKTLKEREDDVSKQNLTEDKYALAYEFAAADKIVVAAPFWDFSLPSALRVYIEQIAVNGITFGYPHGVPTGYCMAEELVYITTAGGYIGENSSLEHYLNELCAMFGIRKLTFIKAEGLDIAHNNPEEILKEAILKL